MIVRCAVPVEEIPHVSSEGDRILIDSGPSEAGSHEVADWLRCPRWWAHSHLGAHARRVKDAYVRGSVMHTGLAHHYARLAVRRQGSIVHAGVKHVDADAFYTPLEAQRVLVSRLSPAERKVALAPGEDDGPSLLDACNDTLTKYVRQAADVFRILAVEDPQRVDLPGNVFHTARVDIVVREVDGVYYDDFKSTVMSIDRASRMYRYALQLLALHTFGRAAHGNDFRGVRAIVISQETGKATRIPVNAPLLINDMPSLLQRTRTDLQRARALYGDNVRAYPPSGVAGSCLDPATGSLCEAHRACAFGD